MGFAAQGYHKTVKKTFVIEGKTYKTSSYNRTDHGNPAGYYVKVNGSKRIFVNFLERDIATEMAIEIYKRKYENNG